jgi:hypothetical protein
VPISERRQGLKQFCLTPTYAGRLARMLAKFVRIGNQPLRIRDLKGWARCDGYTLHQVRHAVYRARRLGFLTLWPPSPPWAPPRWDRSTIWHEQGRYFKLTSAGLHFVLSQGYGRDWRRTLSPNKGLRRD